MGLVEWGQSKQGLPCRDPGKGICSLPTSFHKGQPSRGGRGLGEALAAPGLPLRVLTVNES